jgi:hypothetical protein
MTRRKSGLYVPDPQVLQVGAVHLTDFGRKYLHLDELFDYMAWEKRVANDGVIGGGAGTFSNWFQMAVLAHGTGQDNEVWGNLAPVFLAMCTAVPTSANTGSTITEANYTGYARASMADTVWTAPASGGAGGTSTIGNSATVTYAACTAGSSTILGLALTTAETAGNMIAWASCATVVISAAQTPATVAAGALSLGVE